MRAFQPRPPHGPCSSLQSAGASAWPRRSLGVYQALNSACVGTTEASGPGTLLVSASSIQNGWHRPVWGGKTRSVITREMARIALSIWDNVFTYENTLIFVTM